MHSDASLRLRVVSPTARHVGTVIDMNHSCTPCLSSYWCLAIDEGTLENVACPSIDCVKERAKQETARSEIDPDLVAEVVGLELKDRWEELKERRRAEIGECRLHPPSRSRMPCSGNVIEHADVAPLHPWFYRVFSKPDSRDHRETRSICPSSLRISSQTLSPSIRQSHLILIDQRVGLTLLPHLDPSWTTCPRMTCQAAVPPPATLPVKKPMPSSSSSRVIRLSDIGKSSSTPPPQPPSQQPSVAPPEDRWARHRQCPKCQYSFCLHCSATWHGPHTPCAFPQTSVLVLEYLSYPEDSDARRAMEMRRGKANLDRMVSQYREDQENKRWLESRTRACSGCGVRVEKSHGCNHMTCGRCQTHFCYRCGSSVSRTSYL